MEMKSYEQDAYKLTADACLLAALGIAVFDRIVPGVISIWWYVPLSVIAMAGLTLLLREE